MFLDVFSESNTDDYISFGGIIMDKKVNPVKGMDDIISHMFQPEDIRDIGGVGIDETERMKRNICRILADENMYVSPKNIQIVSETNQAVNYLMTLYLKEGDSVIAEEPIVPDNVSIFRNKGLNLVTVPMEQDGMDLSLIHI